MTLPNRKDMASSQEGQADNPTCARVGFHPSLPAQPGDAARPSKPGPPAREGGRYTLWAEAPATLAPGPLTG